VGDKLSDIVGDKLSDIVGDKLSDIVGDKLSDIVGENDRSTRVSCLQKLLILQTSPTDLILFQILNFIKVSQLYVATT
jgi:hypothetical protein